LAGLGPLDGPGRAGGGAGRVAAAQVALARVLVPGRQREDGAERAGDGAEVAADARLAQHDLGAVDGVDGDGVDRAGLHAPGLVALEAGVGGVAGLLVEDVDADDRARRLEGARLHPGAGQLALHAAGTLVGDDL